MPKLNNIIYKNLWLLLLLGVANLGLTLYGFKVRSDIAKQTFDNQMEMLINQDSAKNQLESVRSLELKLDTFKK